MKFIIVLATTFCLVGGFGIATEHNDHKDPPVAINGDEWNQQNRQDNNDNRLLAQSQSVQRTSNNR